MHEGGYRMCSCRVITILVFVTIVLGQTCPLSAFEEYAYEILSKAPEGWKIAEKRLNAVPEGFSNKYIKGELYVFCGPKKVNWNWKDRTGNWHREALAHESLEVWILPGEYGPGIKTYLTIKGPILPTKVYQSQSVVVYAMPSHRLITSQDEFNRLTSKASEMYWDDSGGKHAISWINWWVSIATALQDIGKSKETSAE